MRLLKHLFARSSHRLFPEGSLQRIADAVAQSEARHRGEVCFAVESSLSVRQILAGLTARERARQLFSQLEVWDTAANNGVLIYLLLADHRIEIIADRGLDDRVGPEDWRTACAAMEQRLRAGEAEAAVIAGVETVSEFLVRHFPRGPDDQDENELSDRPHILS